jgi:hypothetical protein
MRVAIVVLNDPVLVSRVTMAFFGSVGTDGTVDRRTGSKGGGVKGGAISTRGLTASSFNDEGFEALDRDGDGTGRGTWGRGNWGGGFIASLVGDLSEARFSSGRGGKGGLVGGEGHGFREG